MSIIAPDTTDTAAVTNTKKIVMLSLLGVVLVLGIIGVCVPESRTFITNTISAIALTFKF
jgi:hypothetical protein